MEWIFNNWILLLVAALCVGMYFWGGHGKHVEHSEEGPDHHKGHTDSCSSDDSTTKKGGGCCH
ncbi:hypothetical protein BMS3Bbin09_01535 [bacterium BMS3Bbin09]|nr:hypothetical protein BMS3Bbin09_01535 [bacterium BMS3Bbin09]